MKIISVCIALVMFLFSVPVAEAQTSNYTVLKAGAYFPNSGDLNGFGTGFNGEVALGRYFSKNFAGELGLGYFQSSGSASASGTGFTASASGSIYVIPLTVAVKAIYPVDNWELYGIGGMGAYFCNGKADANGTAGGGAFAGSGSSNATAFGGFLGAGATMNIDRSWFIGLEGKYVWAKPGFDFLGEKIDVDFGGWVVTGNVGFRF
jgi:outer membrane protein W